MSLQPGYATVKQTGRRKFYVGCLTVWSDDVRRLFTLYSPIIRTDSIQAMLDAHAERMDSNNRGTVCSSWLNSPPKL